MANLMARLVLFNKPYGVLSQFTAENGHRGLHDFIDIPGIYAAGRLDADSEGLLILTDDGALQHRLADPRHKLPNGATAMNIWLTFPARLEQAAPPGYSDFVNLLKGKGFLTPQDLARPY